MSNDIEVGREVGSSYELARLTNKVHVLHSMLLSLVDEEGMAYNFDVQV